MTTKENVRVGMVYLVEKEGAQYKSNRKESGPTKKEEVSIRPNKIQRQQKEGVCGLNTVEGLNIEMQEMEFKKEKEKHVQRPEKQKWVKTTQNQNITTRR